MSAAGPSTSEPLLLPPHEARRRQEADLQARRECVCVCSTVAQTDLKEANASPPPSPSRPLILGARFACLYRFDEDGAKTRLDIDTEEG
jgi:hypothetical protein